LHQLKIVDNIYIENQLLMKAAGKIHSYFLGDSALFRLPLPSILPGWRDSDSLQKKILTMSKLHFTTQHANEATVTHNWFVVDGTNQTVGRMCSKVASILRGKNKAYYTPHVDCGDFVIVTNAEKVVFSGNKTEDKIYINFSGYPGGKKEESAKSLLKRRPEAVVERAVRGMLPKNRLGRKMFKKLFVYVGAEHPHSAQQPKELTF
jgi:large subunit ribosomal protein L13